MEKITLINNQEFPDKELFFRNMRLKNYLEGTNENVKLTDDWIVVWKPDAQFQMYGKWMWSNKLQKLRNTTMMEFYGKGVVD